MHLPGYLCQHAPILHFYERHLMASGQRLLEIPLDLIHFELLDKCPAFKMQI